MSKELIEKLREDGKFLGGNFGKLMIQAADALEAKAAPVGEWTPATTFPPFGEIVLTNHGPAYMTEKQPGVWFERLENLGIGRRLGAGAVKQWRLRREAEAKVDTQAAVIAELQAELAKPSAVVTNVTVPDGWKLVPVEPTEEMRTAFNRVDAAIYRQPNRSLFKAKHAYAAMLAAAPSALAEITSEK